MYSTIVLPLAGCRNLTQKCLLQPLEWKLMTLHKQITDMLFFKAKAALEVCCKWSYIITNPALKCGRLLAQSLHSQKLASDIPHIVSSTGHKMTLPKHITGEFRSFYESLYNLQTATPSHDHISDYISPSQMPSLPDDAGKLLKDPIKLCKLQSAIGATKPWKAPGSDGFTIQYYKTLLPSLCNYMVKLFNDMGTGKSFREHTLQAHISVIPKEGKDPTSCKRYRLISLLNIDLKLFTKINATRLQQHLPHVIHSSRFCTYQRSQRQYHKGP